MRRNNFSRGESGQSLVIVALMLTMLLGFTGLVIDVGWFEVNLVRVQRAADAAALAGVVYLPGNPGAGATAAQAEATRNGYTTNAATGVTVTAAPDPGNAKVMLTTVTAPVNTFFARLFGVTNFVATRRARAEFILPVPMGSPLDYWGIHVLCRNSDNNNASPNVCPRVASANGVGTLNSLGYWGAIEMRGTQRANGDAYSTYYNGGTALNTGFDPNGYSYIVEVPAGSAGGALWVYDPLFCATGAGGTTSPARRLGVGDFWLGANTPVTTEFKLWDMRGTPYSTSDDVIVATDGGLFSTMNYADRSAAYAGGGDYGSGSASSATDCAGNVYHNNWWRMANNLAPGDYRLQVVTSAGGTTQNAVNNFGLQVTTTSGTGARVYGQTKMCVYNAISGTSLFYLAQVDAVHAGKTLEIKLFDPGDIASTSLRVKIPTSTGYTDATFSFTATGSTGGGPTTGTNLTSLTTSTASTNYYNNQWVTITVNIPTTYGGTGPASITPPGEPGPGWWKIQYVTTGSGQDVTTWEVNIRGNPVHLVIP